MSALSGIFLWLIPLAFLPVIIHLLNRLRYQTVRWAAMMFLRSADRDASRRAKIRQWIILAARCLMLLLFLLALARLQSKGRLARFFDQGSNLVVVMFDRSASMEQLRGGVSGREKALALVERGLNEMGPGTRVLWMDSATGSITPLPGGVELSRLPMVGSSSGTSDMAAMMRTALQEIARAGVSSAEIWIPTDRQISAWIPDGVNTPDWSDWEEMDTQVTIRVLDVAQSVADEGNRSLQLSGEPVREGDKLKVPLKVIRDTAAPESLPITTQFGGLSLRDNIMIEGTTFLWEQVLPIEAGKSEMMASFSIPADSNTADNMAVVAWRDRGAVKAKVDVSDLFVAKVSTAGLLPRDGLREVVDQWTDLDESVSLWIRDGEESLSDEERAWVESGGVVLQLPKAGALTPVDSDDQRIGVADWNEQAGVLANEQREALRLDLIYISSYQKLSAEGEGVDVMARLENDDPLLIRRVVGEGAVYELATVPDRTYSNLASGFVWVPVLQRMLQEGRQGEKRWGIQTLGDWTPEEDANWEDLSETEKDPRLNVGLYRNDNRLIALNRPIDEDNRQLISVTELQEWASPLEMIAFEAEKEDANLDASRFEFTSILALLGLLFLAIESWLLTKNIRKAGVSAPKRSWRAAA